MSSARDFLQSAAVAVAGHAPVNAEPGWDITPIRGGDGEPAGAVLEPGQPVALAVIEEVFGDLAETVPMFGSPKTLVGELDPQTTPDICRASIDVVDNMAVSLTLIPDLRLTPTA